MESFIKVIAVVLVLAYIGCAIWCICRRQTLVGSIGASIVFVCGGMVIIPVAVLLATFVCWATIIVVALAFLKEIFMG